ncbi:MAG: hypothetical protein FWC65_05615, partial [Treponema sp.]|nr:hypothetical protein [Treponema sp.]
MNRFLLCTIPALLFSACASEAGRRGHAPYEDPGILETPHPFAITDFMNMAEGADMPEWVSLWLEGGARAIENMDAHEGRHAFVSRNNGSNFSALEQWAQWFSADLDFPRLAAARIEARFLSGVSRPDDTYGAFFVALVRSASDAAWSGA